MVRESIERGTNLQCFHSDDSECESHVSKKMLPKPVESKNFCQKWFWEPHSLIFEYFTSFMLRAKCEGFRGVKPDELPDLWLGDTISVWCERFFNKMDNLLVRSHKGLTLISSPQWIILAALLSVFKYHLLIIFVMQLTGTLSALISSCLMAVFLESQESNPDQMSSSARMQGVLGGLGILFLDLFFIFFNSQARFWSERIKLRIQGSLTCGIMHSTLKRSIHAKSMKENAVPNSYNMLIVDVGAITDLIFAMLDLLLLPISVTFSYIFLVDRIGKSSLTGIGILLFVIFLMLFLQILNGLLKQSYVEKRDLRLRRTHEVATEVRSIRMLGWGQLAAQYVGVFREKEMKYLKYRMYLDTLAAILANAAYNFTQIAIFTVYIMDALKVNPFFRFKASVVIPVVQVTNKLVEPISVLPFTINSLIEGWVSCERYYKRVCNGRPAFESFNEPRACNIPKTSMYRSTSSELSPLLRNSNTLEFFSQPHLNQKRKNLQECYSLCDNKSSSLEMYLKESEIYMIQVKGFFFWESLTDQNKFPNKWFLRDEFSQLSKDKIETVTDSQIYCQIRNNLIKEENQLKNQQFQKPFFFLTIPEFTVKKRECCFVSGISGSGKSSLVLALLGHMFSFTEKFSIHSIQNSVSNSNSAERNQSIGYTCPSPWIPKGTVQSVILFGRPMDIQRYNRVIEACELTLDLESWTPDGDQRFVCQGGTSLSGGQRSRLSLARALYGFVHPNYRDLPQEFVTHIFFLDDPFASLDPAITNRIFLNLFGVNGLLQYATTILTFHDQFFEYSIHSLIQSSDVLSVDLKKYTLHHGFLRRVALERSCSKIQNHDHHSYQSIYQNSDHTSDPSGDKNSGQKSDQNNDLKVQTKTQSFQHSSRVINTENSHEMVSLIKSHDEEFMVSGSVKSHTYTWFLQQVGVPLILFMVLFIFLQYLLQYASTLWYQIWFWFFYAIAFFLVIFDVYYRLSYWTYSSSILAKNNVSLVSSTTNKTSHENFFFFLNVFKKTFTAIQQEHLPTQEENNRGSLIIFIMLSLGNITFLAILYFFGLVGSLKASLKIHIELVEKIFQGHYCMYKIFPLGVIVNRCNADMDIVDNGPLRTLSGFFGTIISFVLGMSILFFLSPWCSLILPPVAYIVYHYVYKLFRPANRELQRSKLYALSPLCGHLSELESGSFFIKAFGAEKYYEDKSTELTSNFLKTQFMQIGFTCWASTRLALLSFPFTFFNSVVPFILRSLNIVAPIQFFSGLLFGYTQQADAATSAGFTGLAIWLAIRLPTSLGAILWSFSDLEQKMCSLERIESMITMFGSQKQPLIIRQNKFTSNPITPHLKNTPSLFKKCVYRYEDDIDAHLVSRSENIVHKITEIPSNHVIMKVLNLSVSYQVDLSSSHKSPEQQTETCSSFQEPCALRIPNVSAKSGDFIGIVGRTGSGKTTFLLSLLNLLTINHGVILLNDIPICHMSETLINKIIGILPQFPPLFRGWTLRQCVDPKNQFLPSEIYHILSLVSLSTRVAALENGLDTIVMSPSCESDTSSAIFTNAELRTLALARLALHSKNYRLVLVDEPPAENLHSEDHILTRCSSQAEHDTTLNHSNARSVPYASKKTDVADLLRMLFPTSIIIVVAHQAATFNYGFSHVVNLKESNRDLQ
ncbi:ATP-binding cassette sub-family C member 5-like isoform X2 [Hylaeus volcanicus]|uniref:ATP-binding cassette sub-family C member 5-like isoform X2 n=1 Tax=Hylaeus volcanicus TaxID=313075 RepID=UPI0023B862B6|nr:ATP-binding cassette sub-family C member 5-like isoform X2 [Hylaeus volcanicus]